MRKMRFGLLAVIPALIFVLLSKCDQVRAQNTPQAAGAEEVTFPSGGLTLHGFIYRPAGDGRFPIVVWNHGSERLPGWLPELGQFFVRRGYVFFVPHRRGQGRSASAGPYIMDALRQEGSERGAQARSAKLVEMMEVHLQDQLAALEFARTLPYVDADRIAVMGCSFGGIQTLLAAESAPGIRVAVDFAGGAESWESSPDLRNRMLVAARRAKVPVLFVQAQGDYDLSPSKELAKEMDREGKQHEMRIYPAVGKTHQENHEFCIHGSAIWGSDVMEFVEKEFKTAETVQ